MQTFLLTIILATQPTDVPWLKEVTTPPSIIPTNKTGFLEPLLISKSGTTIQSLDGWKTKRAELKQRWLNFLGPMPAGHTPVKFTLISEDKPEGCTRQLVRYEGEPGLTVEAYILRPDKPLNPNGKTPGLVALHATTVDSIHQVAGVRGRESRFLGLKLAQQGFVVVCPRCFLWQDVTTYQQAVDRFQQRHPKTLGMHKMLYDAIRGVDLLASLPEVDTDNIGAVGHSLGAKEALYLAAFDDRIKAAVASEGGLGFKSTNWDAPWYLGKQIHEPDFKLNHHQLMALIAPRPFLVLAGESGRGSADGNRSWPYVQATHPVYKLYGAPPRAAIYNHQQGHNIPPLALQRMTEWLKTYLTP